MPNGALAIDEQFLIHTTSEMIQIDSSNPSLTPGAPGEANLGAYVADLMRTLHMDVTVHELAANRVNVVGIRRASGAGRSLMLNAHLDTVGVVGMAEPFSGAVRDGKLFGRGSQDMKGSLAAMLAAVKAIDEAGVELDGDLILTAVADEEYASIGTADIVRHYHADAAIVTEPTDLAVCRAHRGFVWCDIATSGRAAHGSRYRDGIDAIAHMGRILVELEQLGNELLQRTPHPLAGPPSLHASTIQGGAELSIYPAHCKLQIERRTIPGETVESVLTELEAIVSNLAGKDPTLQATIDAFLHRAPFQISAQAPIVETVDAITRARLGREPKHTGAAFWTDAAILAEAGIDTLLLGPVGQGLHSAEEWVDIQSVVDLAHILAETAAQFCRTESSTK